MNWQRTWGAGCAGWALLLAGFATAHGADGVLPTIAQRFASADVQEVPDFQKHVVPLFGRLGCNGRACHGSFQGRGGFRLSLFGYDFQADHDALFDKESPRVDKEQPLDSLILTKPTSEDEHEGGLRYEKGSWQYHALRRWIEGGARFERSEIRKLASLQVVPSEIHFAKTGETVQLQCIAVWADGVREDVTPLCRFQTNDEQVATIDEDGKVTATKVGDTHVVAFYDKAVVPVPVIRPVTDLVGDQYPSVPTPTRIDELVVAKLRKLGVVPSETCTDAEFVRRIYLDLTGTLPTEDEVRTFLADTSTDKRSRKIDELLTTPAYAAWWTTKLCDFTGNNEEKLNNVGGVRGRATQDWWDWIYQRVHDNTPYDELAAGIVLGKSRNDNETYLEYCRAMSDIARGTDGRTYAERTYMPYYWARTNVRQPEERAIAFAYSFLGSRIECAQCHKHPFDQWSKDDFDQFKRFFTSIVPGNNANNLRGEDRQVFQKLAEEIGIGEARMNQNERQRLIAAAIKDGKVAPFPETFVARPQGAGGDARKAKQKKANRSAAPAATARLLGGDDVELSKYDDPRQPLMDWLRSKDNDFFARSFVNRVWANYFHVGIVTPTDDLNLANPPSNRELLDYLTQGFLEHNFDMKWLHREIANSRTYQLSWHTNDTNELDERNFSHAVPRRLPAEVALDIVAQATGSNAKAAMMLTAIKDRSISIPGASGRNNRGTNFALGVFGRSTRESNCDCDRSMEASLLQTVYLQNDSDVRTKLEARDSWVNETILQLARSGRTEEKSGEDASPDSDLAAKIRSFERKLERLRGQPAKNKVQIARLQRELKEMRARATKPTPSAPEAQASLKPELARTLVESAYLRTLSRFPTQEEMRIATGYLSAEPDAAAGLRDVLWALLNTKEFIVNH
ncbi:MAG: DUF1549 domain-containing protein [Pirellulaceae bacterium]